MYMFIIISWEAEGCYQYSKIHVHVYVHIVSWEAEGRYQYSKMFRWEPEGRYCRAKSMAIALFWIWTEQIFE